MRPTCVLWVNAFIAIQFIDDWIIVNCVRTIVTILQMKASIYHKSNDCCINLPLSISLLFLIFINIITLLLLFIQTNAMFQSTLKIEH